MRGGPDSRRIDSKNLFYPIYVDPEKQKITGVGEPLSFGTAPKIPNNKTVAWPIRTDGSEGRWRTSAKTLREYVEKGYTKLGGWDGTRKTWTVLYLGRKAQKQIVSGAIKISRRNANTGAVELEFTGGEQAN